MAGELPDWYPLLRAAKYLGVAPWELAEQSASWMRWAIIAESAEAETEEERQRRKS